MRFRGFIIVCGLVLAVLLFADRRAVSHPQARSSQVADLTETPGTKKNSNARSGTRIISPAALIPGTWDAAQVPAERLIAPLVVMVLTSPQQQLSVENIANWETQHGYVPQGAIIAVRRVGSGQASLSDQFPISLDAALFLMDARYARGFIIETPARFGSDRRLSRQIALHGNYVVEQSAPLAKLPVSGSLIIVAPEKSRNAAQSPVRVLAIVPT